VRAPLIIPQSSPPSTVNIRPFRRAAASGGTTIALQPLGSSPGDTNLSLAGDFASADIHVVAYEQVPPFWPCVRPDTEYQRAKVLSSTETQFFACPVMGRRRFSMHLQWLGDPATISYRVVGLTAFDDTLREDTILTTTQVIAGVGSGVDPTAQWSRHLDVDSDAYDWLQVYMNCSGAAGTIQALFWVRD
jgi:hypothetical protein